MEERREERTQEEKRRTKSTGPCWNTREEGAALEDAGRQDRDRKGLPARSLAEPKQWETSSGRHHLHAPRSRVTRTRRMRKSITIEGTDATQNMMRVDLETQENRIGIAYTEENQPSSSESMLNVK